MRATTEQMKWENMYRSVCEACVTLGCVLSRLIRSAVALGVFAASIVVVFEFSHQTGPKKPATPTAHPPPPVPPMQQNALLEGVEEQMT